MLKIPHLAALVLSVTLWATSGTTRAQTVPGAAAPDAFQGLPNVAVEYYDVHGTDEASINASLAQNSPVRPDGTRASGSTRYTMPFQPYRAGTGASCKVTKVRAAPGAIVTLPRLADESAVPERILAIWRPFIAALRVHEAGHIRIEYQHVNDVVAAMIGSRCDQTRARFDAAMVRIRALQDAYDRETKDGATQGVTLQ